MMNVPYVVRLTGCYPLLAVAYSDMRSIFVSFSEDTCECSSSLHLEEVELLDCNCLAYVRYIKVNKWNTVWHDRLIVLMKSIVCL